jgi:hypothetical protein
MHSRLQRSLRAALVAAVAVLAVPAAAAAGGAATAARCDPIDPALCLLPWPNDHFTVPDGRTPTGRRLALTRAMMPRNVRGVPLDAADYNRSDGFSPGQVIVTRVPGLDTPAALRRTGAVPITDMARAFERRQPVVVIDARTRRRHLIWAELDARATRPESVALLIHPGVSWKEGRRYIVALRGLRDARGRLLRPGLAFRRYRDRIPTRSPSFERRRAHMEEIFRTLRRARIARGNLYRAWDFTVSSRRSLSQRLLSIRDSAFRSLGDANLRDLRPAGRPPRYTVDSVREVPTGPVLREIRGRVTVPCYLDRPGCPPGARFRLDRRGLPRRRPGNTTQAPFVCVVPRSASLSNPALPALFGHGLFGSATDVLGAVGEAFSSVNALPCAADFTGLSREDLANLAEAVQDLSRFPSVPDRLQQGLVNFMYLGRLLVHPRGFAADPRFTAVNRRALAYLGASLGGIEGGALTAVAPDFTRAALVVPAMNFSLLLPRSTQADPYFALIERSYRPALTRTLLLSMIGLLWERGEANAYAQHMTRDPYPNTPRHEVLLHMAFGDHQVANVATEVEARTIGAHLRTPALDPGRSPDRRPFYRIPRIRRLPFGGSALVVWDIGPLRAGGAGTPPPPVTNTPPRLGRDPHAVTPFEPAAAAQFLAFLRPGGAFVNVCGARPCYSAGWTGPSGSPPSRMSSATRRLNGSSFS